MDDLIDKHRARIAAANEKLKLANLAAHKIHDDALAVAAADHSAEILDSEVALEAGMKARHDAFRGVVPLKLPVVTTLPAPIDQSEIPPKPETEDEKR